MTWQTYRMKHSLTPTSLFYYSWQSKVLAEGTFQMMVTVFVVCIPLHLQVENLVASDDATLKTCFAPLGLSHMSKHGIVRRCSVEGEITTWSLLLMNSSTAWSPPGWCFSIILTHLEIHGVEPWMDHTSIVCPSGVETVAFRVCFIPRIWSLRSNSLVPSHLSLLWLSHKRWQLMHRLLRVNPIDLNWNYITLNMNRIGLKETQWKQSE